MRLQARAWLVLMLLFAFAAGARAAASAHVDRDRIALSESFQLTIRVEGSMRAEDPDLAPLERHFEVLGSNRNSSFTLSNGRRESATTWQVTLMARHAGELTIPALAVGGERTQPIAIRVSEDPAPAAAAAREVQLQVETDTAELHVQQQLLLTVRLLHAVNLNRGATLEAPEIPDAVVRELGENSYEKVIDGRRYGVFERRYAVFPQESGELVVPALGFQAALGGGGGWFDQFGSRGKMLRLRSEEKRIRVLPPEAGATPWLPARVLTVIETWDKSPQELRVGDSATRTVTITATGLTGAQLPPLPAPAVEGAALLSRPAAHRGRAGRRGHHRHARREQRRDSLARRRHRVPGNKGALVGHRQPALRGGRGPAPHDPRAAGRERRYRAQPRRTRGCRSRRAGSRRTRNARTGGCGAGINTLAAATPPWPWIIATLLLALATVFSSWQWWRATRAASRTTAPQPGTPEDAREAELFAALAQGLPRQRCGTGAGAAAALGTRRLPARRHPFGQRYRRGCGRHAARRAHRAPARQPLCRHANRHVRSGCAARAIGHRARSRHRPARPRLGKERAAAALLRRLKPLRHPSPPLRSRARTDLHRTRS